jgi:hypothetical protein
VTSLIKGRQFQLWEYHVSHGSLLFRSPEGVGHRGTVDIICTGVQYVAAPRLVGEIEVARATADEVAEIEKILGKKIQLPEQVYVLETARGRFPLVAVSLSIQEHRGSVFKSPLC